MSLDVARSIHALSRLTVSPCRAVHAADQNDDWNSAFCARSKLRVKQILAQLRYFYIVCNFINFVTEFGGFNMELSSIINLKKSTSQGHFNPMGIT